MSYDVWLEADLGGPEAVQLNTLEANCTYNVYPMLAKAGSESPNKWDKASAAEVAVKCKAILDAFNQDPSAYRALNPPNGWGSFEGARAFIQLIHDACLMAPRATVRVG